MLWIPSFCVNDCPKLLYCTITKYFSDHEYRFIYPNFYVVVPQFDELGILQQGETRLYKFQVFCKNFFLVIRRIVGPPESQLHLIHPWSSYSSLTMYTCYRYSWPVPWSFYSSFTMYTCYLQIDQPDLRWPQSSRQSHHVWHYHLSQVSPQL